MSRFQLINGLVGLFLLGLLIGSSVLGYPSLPFLIFSSFIIIYSFTRLPGVVPTKFLAAFCLGFLYVQLWRTSNWVSYPSHVTLTGTIVDIPDVRQNKTFLTVQPDQNIGKDLHRQAKAGKLLVQAPRYPAYKYGDHVSLTGTVEKPAPFSGFNYPLFLERAGIYGIVTQPEIHLTAPAHFSLQGSLYGLQTGIQNTIQHFIPEPESSFLGGILLGSKRSIPQDLQDALKATGTSHIVVISGANITIVLSILLHLLPLYKRRQQFLATLFIALFITFLTGASASVVRGAAIAILAQYIRLRGRRAWATPLILFSMAIILLNNPLLLRADPGFQLSFAAYAGLVYFGSPLKKHASRFSIFTKLPEIIQGIFSETLAATLGTAPLAFLLFGQLSLLGLVVNPLVLWLLPLTTLLGLAFVCTGWLPMLGTVLSLPLWLILHAILTTIEWFSQFQFAVIHAKP